MKQKGSFIERKRLKNEKKSNFFWRVDKKDIIFAVRFNFRVVMVTKKNSKNFFKKVLVGIKKLLYLHPLSEMKRR
ncbi:hypothetical protein EDL99_05725 [Ornithobacterium rhinotracheale]|nr:hypothetical protein [Ornithobacterium rhinotracheale]